MMSVFSSEKKICMCSGSRFVGSTMSIVIASARSKLHKKEFITYMDLKNE